MIEEAQILGDGGAGIGAGTAGTAAGGSKHRRAETALLSPLPADALLARQISSPAAAAVAAASAARRLESSGGADSAGLGLGFSPGDAKSPPLSAAAGAAAASARPASVDRTPERRPPRPFSYDHVDDEPDGDSKRAAAARVPSEMLSSPGAGAAAVLPPGARVLSDDVKEHKRSSSALAPSALSLDGSGGSGEVDTEAEDDASFSALVRTQSGQGDSGNGGSGSGGGSSGSGSDGGAAAAGASNSAVSRLRLLQLAVAKLDSALGSDPLNAQLGIQSPAWPSCPAFGSDLIRVLPFVVCFVQRPRRKCSARFTSRARRRCLARPPRPIW